MFMFVAGGTGFVGQNLMPELARLGHSGACLVRSMEKVPTCANFRAVSGSLDDIPSGALDGMDMVVHLIGIMEERDSATFESIHVKGTANLVNEALKAGVRRFFYQSSLGASLSSRSRYQKSKARAEEIVRESGLRYTIFRPSLLLGRGDGFTKQMVKLINASPVVAVPGAGNSKFQPLAVSDWVKCFLVMLEDGRFLDGVYEMGGREQFSFNELVNLYIKTMGAERKVIHLPTSLVEKGIVLLNVARAAGIRNLPPLSKDQLALLEADNITDIDSIKKQFGFEPVSIRDELGKYIS